ncbi:hypothetical protein SB861_63500, partial [Paraburkholderia sp. SIMBA_049]
GDMIAQSAIDNGWAGFIVYGCVRDVDDMAEMALGVMALGCIPRKSTRRDEGQTDIEISFGRHFQTREYSDALCNRLRLSALFCANTR